MNDSDDEFTINTINQAPILDAHEKEGKEEIAFTEEEEENKMEEDETADQTVQPDAPPADEQIWKIKSNRQWPQPEKLFSVEQPTNFLQTPAQTLGRVTNNLDLILLKTAKAMITSKGPGTLKTLRTIKFKAKQESEPEPVAQPIEEASPDPDTQMQQPAPQKKLLTKRTRLTALNAAEKDTDAQPPQLLSLSKDEDTIASLSGLLKRFQSGSLAINSKSLETAQLLPQTTWKAVAQFSNNTLLNGLSADVQDPRQQRFTMEQFNEAANASQSVSMIGKAIQSASKVRAQSNQDPPVEQDDKHMSGEEEKQRGEDKMLTQFVAAIAKTTDKSADTENAHVATLYDSIGSEVEHQTFVETNKASKPGSSKINKVVNNLTADIVSNSERLAEIYTDINNEQINAASRGSKAVKEQLEQFNEAQIQLSYLKRDKARGEIQEQREKGQVDVFESFLEPEKSEDPLTCYYCGSSDPPDLVETNCCHHYYHYLHQQKVGLCKATGRYASGPDRCRICNNVYNVRTDGMAEPDGSTTQTIEQPNNVVMEEEEKEQNEQPRDYTVFGADDRKQTIELITAPDAGARIMDAFIGQDDPSHESVSKNFQASVDGFNMHTNIDHRISQKDFHNKQPFVSKNTLPIQLKAKVGDSAALIDDVVDDIAKQVLEQQQMLPDSRTDHAKLVADHAARGREQLTKQLNELNEAAARAEEEDEEMIREEQLPALQAHSVESAYDLYRHDVTQLITKPVAVGLSHSLNVIDSIANKRQNRIADRVIRDVTLTTALQPDQLERAAASRVHAMNSSARAKDQLGELISNIDQQDATKKLQRVPISAKFEGRLNNTTSLNLSDPLHQVINTNLDSANPIQPAIEAPVNAPADVPASDAVDNTSTELQYQNKIDTYKQQMHQQLEQRAATTISKLDASGLDIEDQAMMQQLNQRQADALYKLQQKRINANINPAANQDAAQQQQVDQQQQINEQADIVAQDAASDSLMVEEEIKEELKEHQEDQQQQQEVVQQQQQEPVQQNQFINDNVDMPPVNEEADTVNVQDARMRMEQEKQAKIKANQDEKARAEIERLQGLAQLKVDASNSNLERHKAKLQKDYEIQQSVAAVQEENKKDLAEQKDKLTIDKATDKITQNTKLTLAKADKQMTTHLQQKAIKDLDHNSRMELFKLTGLLTEGQVADKKAKMKEMYEGKLAKVRGKISQREEEKKETDIYKTDLTVEQKKYDDLAKGDKASKIKDQRTAKLAGVAAKTSALEKDLQQKQDYKDQMEANNKLFDIQRNLQKEFKDRMIGWKKELAKKKTQAQIDAQTGALSNKFDILASQFETAAKQQELKENGLMISKVNVLKQQVQNSNKIVNTTISQLLDQLNRLKKQEESERNKLGEGNYTTDLIRNISAFRDRTLPSNNDLSSMPLYQEVVKTTDALAARVNEDIQIKSDKLLQAMRQDQNIEQVDAYIQDREELNRVMASNTYDMLDAAFRKNGMKPLSLSKEEFLNKYASLSLDMSSNGLKKRRVNVTVPVARSIDKISSLSGDLNDDDVRNIVSASAETTFGNVMANIYELQQYLIRKATEKPEKKEMATKFMERVNKYVQRNQESILGNSRAFFGTQYSKLAVADMLRQEDENHKLLQQAKQRKKEDNEREKQLNVISQVDPSRLMPGGSSNGSMPGGGGSRAPPAYEHKFKKGFYPNSLYQQQYRQQQQPVNSQAAVARPNQYSKPKAHSKDKDKKKDKDKAVKGKTKAIGKDAERKKQEHRAKKKYPSRNIQLKIK